MAKKKPRYHIIPLETSVCFSSSLGKVYKVSDYIQVLGPCPKDCSLDHDCYDEPYITVREEIRTAFPLSELRLVFQGDVGRAPTTEEFKTYE